MNVFRRQGAICVRGDAVTVISIFGSNQNLFGEAFFSGFGIDVFNVPIASTETIVIQNISTGFTSTLNGFGFSASTSGALFGTVDSFDVTSTGTGELLGSVSSLSSSLQSLTTAIDLANELSMYSALANIIDDDGRITINAEGTATDLSFNSIFGPLGFFINATITYNGNSAANQIIGSSENEHLYGFDGDDTLIASGGSDRLYGGFGNDSLSGGSSSDSLEGESGFDTLRGGTGNDTLLGGNGADSLYGDDGNDRIQGGRGFDQLFGGDGNDTLFAGDTADRVFGGEGNDSISGGSNFGVTVDGLFGEAGDDTIYGDGGFDLLDGGTGDDSLDGGNQADNLFGRDGEDTLLGGQGLDRLFGGNDDDLAYGGTGNDGLFGDFGNDTLYGEDGNDRFFGASGNDLIFGGADNDTINGGSGFDTIDGGTGDDIMFGRFNADRFVFVDGHGNDTIGDFNALNNFERIDFSGLSTINSLADLNVGSATLGAATQVGGNVVIDTGGGNSITLSGVTLGDLDNFDFVF
mmetsp:Transcript_23217/g.39857  ORF Transcript_23217/g.39857 Transcript_23217/m.39857 type:complete len:522 (+) Transcript_23217:256-1821(+)